MSWTDELKEQVIAEYQEANPTPENSMEIVKELAEKHDQSPNGVRMILSRAEVYVKKTASDTKSTTSTASKRVSKADAQASLVSAIQDAGQEVDSDIVEKLTGKAAVYFASVISAVNS